MVEFDQICNPYDVYRFIRERDRNQDFVLDSEEVPAAFISRYDRKEGAFSKKIEGFELMQARSLVCPIFFSRERMAEEQKASYQWLALRDRFSRQLIPDFIADHFLVDLSLAATASVEGGKLFASAVADLDNLDKIYFEKETKDDFPWRFRAALTAYEDIGKDGGDPDWLYDVLAKSPDGHGDPEEIQNLWRRVRREGSAEQTMDFIGQLISAGPRYILGANSSFDNNVGAFQLEWDYTWKKDCPPVPTARRQSLIFASPFLMTGETGKAFIEFPLRVMIDQGYFDQEIADLFKVYRDKRKELMSPLAEALTALKDAGVSLFVRHQILKEIGTRFEDEPAQSALNAIARGRDGLARMLSHYAVHGDDQQIKDLLSLCFSRNSKEPGPVITLAARLGYRSWTPSRVETVINSLPELDGDYYYLQVGELIQRLWDQHVYEQDIAYLFSALGSRYHGRDGSSIFVRKVQEAYLLIEPSPLARQKSGISDRKRFQNFLEAQKS